MDPNSIQAWIAAIAAVISVGAAVFSAMQARHAERQADAAHGNIEPTFYLKPPGPKDYANFFALVVKNYHRDALQILSITATVPAQYEVHTIGGERLPHTPISSEKDAFAIDLRGEAILEGVPPGGAAATSYQYEMEVFVPDSPEFSRKIICQIEVEYQQLDGLSKARKKDLSIELDFTD